MHIFKFIKRISVHINLRHHVNLMRTAHLLNVYWLILLLHLVKGRLAAHVASRYGSFVHLFHLYRHAFFCVLFVFLCEIIFFSLPPHKISLMRSDTPYRIISIWGIFGFHERSCHENCSWIEQNKHDTWNVWESLSFSTVNCATDRCPI